MYSVINFHNTYSSDLAYQIKMKIYKVGGSVRDKILSLPHKDNDWVVIGADKNDLLKLGFIQVGSNFPVFLHPTTKEEYALARTEKKVASGYKGFDLNTSKHITLKDDLKRRDLTINAIAEDDKGQLIDPYNGLKDIKNKILKHISPAFNEDPLRVLRVARFAAKLNYLGFKIAPATLNVMREISYAKELETLPKERIWQELSKALMEKSPELFITVLLQ